jgi:hypothetical protein
MVEAVRIRLDGKLVDEVAAKVRSQRGQTTSLPECVEEALRGWLGLDVKTKGDS